MPVTRRKERSKYPDYIKRPPPLLSHLIPLYSHSSRERKRETRERAWPATTPGGDRRWFPAVRRRRHRRRRRRCESFADSGRSRREEQTSLLRRSMNRPLKQSKTRLKFRFARVFPPFEGGERSGVPGGGSEVRVVGEGACRWSALRFFWLGFRPTGRRRFPFWLFPATLAPLRPLAGGVGFR
jgi:hypothetical protein